MKALRSLLRGSAVRVASNLEAPATASPKPCGKCSSGKPCCGECKEKADAPKAAPQVAVVAASVPPPSMAMKAPSSAQDGPTACIVTCHNYGRFLRQCLESLIIQTLGFSHIVVVDDSSSDDTSAICAQYASRGVRYLRGNWRDACKARRAGIASLPRSRFLLFVDADNWLEPDYHERLRAVMDDPRLGVAYGAIRLFEDGGTYFARLAKPFDYAALRRDNYVDTCSLIRTEAYAQVGGWEPVGGLQDWLLWLKITRAGWTMQLVPDAVMHYRRHAASMSMNRVKSQMEERGRVEVMQRGFVVTIVTLFSGREWMLDRFAEMLRALIWPRENLRLVAIDNSRSLDFGERLRKALDSTGVSHIIVTNNRSGVVDHAASEVCDSAVLRSRYAYAINEHLAHLYAQAREVMPAGTDWVWSVEDDIEPPADALLHFAAGFHRHQKAGVLCGAVVNRFRAGARLLSWVGSWSESQTTDFSDRQKIPARGTYTPVTASGFMCTIFRREVWDRIAFRASPFWNMNRSWYDWAAAHEVARLGWKWMLVGSVRCLHWQANGTALVVPEVSGPRDEIVADPSSDPECY